MNVILATSDHRDWYSSLSKAMGTYCPTMELHEWPSDSSDADIAVVWKPPAEFWSDYPNLRCVFALGAGVEDLHDVVPGDVQIVRLIDPELTTNMTEYVVSQVLYQKLNMSEYAEQQSRCEWKQHRSQSSASWSVGILGLGQLGGHTAATLAAMGFTVYGWSRRPKEIGGVHCATGRDGLLDLLGNSDIVVCMLPLTDDTRDLMGIETFMWMRPLSYFINVGRGEHIVDMDLLEAIDNYSLSGATLDVFRTEPLPEDHPFWSHPKIKITPHSASITNRTSASAIVAQNIHRYYAGHAVKGIVDRVQGY